MESDLLLRGGINSGRNSLKAFELSSGANSQFDLLRKASVLSEMGRYDQSLEFIDRALSGTFKDSEAYESKSWILHQLGRYKESFDAANEAIGSNPRSGWAWCLAAIAKSRLNEKKECRRMFQVALEIDPNQGAIHANWAMFLECERDWRGAEVEFRRALALEPRRAEFHVHLGRLLGNRGRLEESESLCLHALEIDPENSNALNLLGDVRRAGGRYADAMTNYENGLRIDPTDPYLAGKLSELRRKFATALTFGKARTPGNVWGNPRYGKAVLYVFVFLLVRGCVHAALETEKSPSENIPHPAFTSSYSRGYKAPDNIMKSHLAATIGAIDTGSVAKALARQSFERPRPKLDLPKFDELRREIEIEAANYKILMKDSSQEATTILLNSTQINRLFFRGELLRAIPRRDTSLANLVERVKEEGKSRKNMPIAAMLNLESTGDPVEK